ncbi:hypothetical protein HBH56_043970 [Parastagonospora nodorum]|uniref:Rhodopsin domain-containing protein n=1 Tax=Phaeosphaeria nodorum (strain SN15 / ATCC MYA-4574 / FGSC 10173) TaxID=321614 RepID=A0A7U2HWE6_PHANO|nr:hypothetical protein HBH56_043970 [Parastagonospora nodorum]QRC92804.1 hypothetical protein JI435_081400 [Parastagonospora nodorum SN15]KAH3933339.1 hypothetical protein HBH54_071720 [Parastagonospora nodorum]KAH4139829.1 hypothetical protein HBH45_091940 [Parastagonospora nodorum]KAH4168801.1 hypothetical protein HBH44_044660 [Parastagonospora nodorum]
MAEDGLARQHLVVGVSTALTAVSVIIVSLRVYTRAVILHNMGNDDYTMLIALLFTLAYLATIYILRANGMGFRGTQVTFEQATTTLQVTYAIEIIYYLCVNAIKVSILFFYLRIAAEKTFERLCKATIYLLLTFCLVCIIVVLAQCRPLHKMWDLTGMVPGSCINTSVFIYITSATNILLDIWILILPIKLLLSIQRPGREKSALLAIFALGAFSCIASIVRLYSVRIFTTSTDPFFSSVPINTWSQIEINVGIWCASIPALKALFSKAQRARTQHTLSHGYQYHGSERSGGSESVRKGVGRARMTKSEEFVMEEMVSGYGKRGRV